jgi:hypothetical protein
VTCVFFICINSEQEEEYASEAVGHAVIYIGNLVWKS